MKKILFFTIMALILVMGFTLPVSAGDLGGGKNPVPVTEVIYYVGDTVDYELFVENPSYSSYEWHGQIWELLPDGTTLQLETDKHLAIGERVTFNLSWPIAPGDLQWTDLGGTFYNVVFNQVYTVNGYHIRPGLPPDPADGAWGTSVIVIQPETEMDISATPMVTCADQEVILTIAECNTGDSDIHDVSVAVTDEDATTLDIELVGPPDSGDTDSDGILDGAGSPTGAECWVWEVPVYPSFSQTYTATGSGLDLLDNPVPSDGETDSVEVTVVNPSIDIEKYVSVDGGVTWEDADAATGPYAAVGSDVLFKVEVCNTGDVTLTGIVVTDTDFEFTGVLTELAPGACDESDVKTVTAVAGQQYDEACVTGTPPVGDDVTDCDPANYFGSNPSIDIEKYVSVDGGVTWEDADAATGPSAAAGSDVLFKVEVCNTGNVPLTGILVTDTEFAFTGVLTELAPGACDESDVVTVPAVGGQQYDEACVTGTPPVGEDVTDCDPAYYYGEEQFEGCTPGFWKNNAAKWDAVAWPESYEPSDKFSEVFGLPEPITVRAGGKATIYDPTLLQALQANGGGVNALARHAVAALLNAAHPDINYAMTEAEVIDAVHDALTSGDGVDVLMLAEDLDWYNNKGCPINQHGVAEQNGEDGMVTGLAMILPLLGVLSLRRREVSA